MKKLILSLCVMIVFAAPAQAGEVFDRVMKDRVLRCAYTIYPPFVSKNPNTGEFSGIFYDAVEAVGEELSIDVQWTEEVGSDGILQGLETGRYDAVCAGYFTTPSRANGADFTKHVIYSPTYIYVRADETRFQGAKDLNAEAVKMGVMDGEYSDVLRNQRFPKTQPVSLMGLSSAAERFELIATGKADFTIAESALGLDYMANNPGKLKPLGPPVSMGASVILLPQDEYPLVAFLNAGIDSLILSGKLELILDQYQKHEGEFLMPAAPYAMP
ncbi:MAG: amino acid ABC transporter substrate-binding protein [Alphaproteobacteria bacterium]|nr:amino acid ABC transporter substrate-binding protein [Alphaproteobacteria bacterium]